jgi:tetratricopeptide (TPR) repeat protein
MKHLKKGFGSAPQPNDRTSQIQRAQQLFSQAVQQHQSGRLVEAETSYQQAIELQPKFVDAHYNLGHLLLQLGKHAEAEASYRTAVSLRPNFFEAQYNLGDLLLQIGRITEAELQFRLALSLRPDAARAYNGLGISLWQQAQTAPERLVEAEAAYRQAVALDPGYLDAWNGLGAVLTVQKKLGEAYTAFLRAVSLNPSLATSRYNLGNVCLEEGKLKESAKLVEAEASFRVARSLQPDSSEIHDGLGSALLEQSRVKQSAAPLVEAELFLRQALSINPKHTEAHFNLSGVYLEQGRLDEAERCLRQAIALKTDMADAHAGLACVLLMQGNFSEGWQEYEWRWRTKMMGTRQFLQPKWDGSDLQGRTILLWAEQGHGDAIQFIRYAALVKAMGAIVILECRPPEFRLFQSCPSIDHLLTTGEPLPSFDFHVPLMSLPRLLGTTIETIPNQIPYLSATAPCLMPEEVQDHLRLAAGLKIGLVWSPKLSFSLDFKRRYHLEQLATLFEVPGLSWFSLQKGTQGDELERYGQRVIDLGFHFEDFADTACAIEQMDVVITVDTSVAHLAGALGKETWVLLPFAPDWRWLLDREDSPWYPSVSLFRPPALGDWQSVVAQLKKSLMRRTGVLASQIAPLN